MESNVLGLKGKSPRVSAFRSLRLGALLALVSVIALGLLSACSSDDGSEPADSGTTIKTGGTLKVGMLSDHVGFDPPLLLGMPDIVTVIHTHDTLVRRDPDMTLSPALAESWTHNTDGSEWTFNLRKGVKFHHGKEFKAEDVVFTFNRMIEVDSPLAAVLGAPTAIVAVDDYTVRFEFPAPNAVLLDAIVKYQAHISPSDLDPETFASEPIGTGPFVLNDYKVGETATFTKNADYWWEGHPYVDELIFVFLPDPQSRAEALKARTIDIVYDMEVASVPGVNGNEGTHAVTANTGGYMNLAMITTEPPFDNKLVRKAVQAVTDRDAILQTALLGLGGIAYDHPITSADPNFDANCKPPAYDPDLAKDLLAQAGYPDGIDLVLHTSTSGAAMVEMATVMKEKAAPAGINIEIEVMSEDGYWAEGWMVKPFTTVWWGGRPPYEAFTVVYKGGGGWNESFWTNAEADALMDQAMMTADPVKQKEIYGKLQCLVVEEAPRILPVFLAAVLGLGDDVEGMEPMWDKTMQLHRAWLNR